MNLPIHRNVRVALRPGEDERVLQMSLMGAFRLTDGAASVVLSGASQRLLAFVALQGRPVSRDATAGALWPDASEAQAHASLRSAIWRLEQLARDSMSINVLELDLAANVTLDINDAKSLAHRVLIVDTMPAEGDMTPAAIESLSSELLPDWYDDWALVRAEDWHQLRLHALEALGQKLLDVQRFADAIEAVSEAARADPLRESPHALLIRIHLAEGNQSEALRAFGVYRDMLRRELGIEPSAALRDLVRGLLP